MASKKINLDDIDNIEKVKEIAPARIPIPDINNQIVFDKIAKEVNDKEKSKSEVRDKRADLAEKMSSDKVFNNLAEKHVFEMKHINFKMLLTIAVVIYVGYLLEVNLDTLGQYLKTEQDGEALPNILGRTIVGFIYDALKLYKFSIPFLIILIMDLTPTATPYDIVITHDYIEVPEKIFRQVRPRRIQIPWAKIFFAKIPQNREELGIELLDRDGRLLGTMTLHLKNKAHLKNVILNKLPAEHPLHAFMMKANF